MLTPNTVVLFGTLFSATRTFTGAFFLVYPSIKGLSFMTLGC